MREEKLNALFCTWILILHVIVDYRVIQWSIIIYALNWWWDLSELTSGWGSDNKNVYFRYIAPEVYDEILRASMPCFFSIWINKSFFRFNKLLAQIYIYVQRTYMYPTIKLSSAKATNQQTVANIHSSQICSFRWMGNMFFSFLFRYQVSGPVFVCIGFWLLSSYCFVAYNLFSLLNVECVWLLLATHSNKSQWSIFSVRLQIDKCFLWKFPFELSWYILKRIQIRFIDANNDRIHIVCIVCWQSEEKWRHEKATKNSKNNNINTQIHSKQWIEEQPAPNIEHYVYPTVHIVSSHISSFKPENNSPSL